MSWSISIREDEYTSLQAHLFPGDRDEHAAFMFAGVHRAARDRLLVRKVVPVPDADFGASQRGAYRAISARAVARAARKCDEEGLCLIWTHSHPGSGISAGFSQDDRDSHERAHPSLIDMTHGRPVGSVVFGEESAAGEVWLGDGTIAATEFVRVIGSHIRDLTPGKRQSEEPADRFARQVLLFGKEGQAVLKRMTVAVAGAGGGGSLIVQSLAHLGVGRLIVIDFDTVSNSNLSRLVGAGPMDVGRLKIDVLRDMVARIDPDVAFDGVEGDITYTSDAARVAEADFAFLATDTTYARYAFNAICHQYLIPGIQVGSKVGADAHTGSIDLVHVMERPLPLMPPCLMCGGAINRDRLRREQLSDAELDAQNYVGNENEEEVADPSVITLNSISTSLATTDFLLMVMGLLRDATDLGHRAYYPEERRLRSRALSPEPDCRFCRPDSRYTAFAAGDLLQLPLRPGARPPTATDAVAEDSAPTATKSRWWQRVVKARAPRGGASQ